MKKLLIIAAVALAGITANASYLYWQVGTFDDINLTDMTAGIGVFTESAGVYTRTATLGFVGASTAASTTQETYLGDFSGSGYYYAIELYSSANSSYATEYRSNTYSSYTDLVATGSLTTTMREVAKATAMKASGYTAVPEPTSGLLTLIGMALLGLRRKRA